MAESSSFPRPPNLIAKLAGLVGIPSLGVQTNATPPPTTADGTNRQWPIFVGFQVPQRQSSSPVLASCAVRQSPPTMSNFKSGPDGPPEIGMGVLKASCDSWAASHGRTCFQISFPVLAS